MGCCNSFSLKDNLKQFISPTNRLYTLKFVSLVVALGSLISLIICIAGNRWFTEGNGHHGLWKNCIREGTSTCCEDFELNVGVMIARVGLLLQLPLYVGKLVLIIMQMYKDGTSIRIRNSYAPVYIIPVYLCTFTSLSMLICLLGYGISALSIEDTQVSFCFILCILNCIAQWILLSIIGYVHEKRYRQLDKFT